MKVKIILVSLALTRWIMCRGKFIKLVGLPLLMIHRLVVEWIFCVEISWHTKVGKNLMLFHAFGIVVHRDCSIGDNCIIRQNTTIGTKTDRNGVEGLAPQIGNNVDIGAGVNIIGDIVIGDNVAIGAGAVVVHSVPSNTVVVGNPAKEINCNK